LDETWVNQNHSRGQIWQNAQSTEGLKVPTGKGSRLLICHAGSSKFGFVDGSKLVSRCKSSLTQSDYHTQMNAAIFKGWFIDMLNKLEEPCVIVMDNASYYSVLSVNYPKSNATKSSVQEWLREKGVDFSPLETFSELRERVKSLIPREKIYELDEIALRMGHEFICLPPYHCQYNPIELIWAQVKGEIAKTNTTLKFDDVEKLLNNALHAVSVDNWKKCTDHCHKLQDDDFIKEGLRDEILAPIILTINPDSSDSENDNNEI